jgi:hypothetical protein
MDGCGAGAEDGRGMGAADGCGTGAARQRRGVSRVATVPQNAGLLLASVQPRCNTRYRQQAITPINLLQLGTEKSLGVREWTSTPTLNSRYG